MDLDSQGTQQVSRAFEIDVAHMHDQIHGTPTAALELASGLTLQVGGVLAAGSVVATGLNLADADPAPVVPPVSAFAGLGNMTISDASGDPSPSLPVG